LSIGDKFLNRIFSSARIEVEHRRFSQPHNSC
jgi:hypothetical protein